MGDLSDHFSRHEFACKCGCGQDTVDAELLVFLEKLRVYFDKPITINSGNRCRNYNERIGGAVSSQHMKSRAADIVVKDTDPGMVANAAEHIVGDRGGLGRYDTFTHIDSRGYRARWNG